MEDLLNTEIGKNDYDWLLTPPGTPRDPTLDAAEKAPSSIVTKHTVTRSSSTTRASRLSTYETENGHLTFPTRPARSISVSCRAVQSTPNNIRSSIVNANISSVNSRSTTQSKRTATLTASKPSVASSRPVPTRSSTPVEARLSTPTHTHPSTPVKKRPSVSNSMANSAVPKNTSAPCSRSSTPTSRSRTLSSSSSSSTSAVSRPSSSSGKVPAITYSSSSSSTVSSVSRPSSRSSTPTRQPAMRSSTPSARRISGSNNMTSNGRPLASSGRSSAPSSAPSSRPSSPNTRTQAPVHPLGIPDFPNETPPNLRAKLPERPLSAGRVRPGITSGVRSTPNPEPVLSVTVKKMSVPAITRSKFSDVQSKTSLTNNHQSRPSERSLLEGQTTRTSRSVAAADNGFGRTISRKSLDMAIRHMDIRQNLGGIRGASLFPHSIRSTTTKSRPARASDPGHCISNGDRCFTDNSSSNGHFSGDSNGALSHNGGSSIGSPDSGKKEVLSELDIYANSRYDAMLLKEDTKNMSWLHSVDDKSDQSPVFDHRFEPLPEPFGPL